MGTKFSRLVEVVNKARNQRNNSTSRIPPSESSTSTGETGHDPAVHGARMEDRFYNNDAFRSPGVDSGDSQQQDAALKIQTEYRRHSAKKEVEGMREEDAATTIQAGVRGQQDRQKVDEMKETEARLKSDDVDINLEDPEVAAAAVKIQAGFKGYKARKEVKESKSKSEETTEEGDQGETNVTQQESEEAKDDHTDLERDPNANDAATKIQAGFRGHKVRQEVKARKEAQETTEEKKEEIDINLEDPDVEKAATKIQAGFRGHKARKEMKETRETSGGEDAGVSDTGEVNGEKSDETKIDEIPEQKTDEVEQETSDSKEESGEVSEQKTDEVSEQKTDEVSEQKTDEISEQKTDEVSEQKTDEVSEQKTDEVSEEESASNKKTEAEPEENAEHQLEQTSQEIAQETVNQVQSEEKLEETVSDTPAEKTTDEKSEEKVEESPSTQTEEQNQQPSQDAPTSETEKTDPEKVDIDLDDPEVVKAATKIQAGFKGYKTRKDVKGQQPDQDTEMSEGDHSNTDDIDLNDPDVAKAATKIQASFKGHQVRKEIRKKQSAYETDDGFINIHDDKHVKDNNEIDIDLADPDVEKAATKIQAGYKGLKTRRELKSVKDPEPSLASLQSSMENDPHEVIDIDLTDPDVEKAAVKIQSSFKSLRSRKSKTTVADSTKVESSPPININNTKLGTLPFVKVPVTEEIDIDLKDPEVAKAALKIQSTFKGLKSRKLNTKKSECPPPINSVKLPSPVTAPVEDEIDIDLNDPEVAKAAIKIQSTFKGLKSRKIKTKQSTRLPPNNMEPSPPPPVSVPEEEIDIDLDDPEVEKAALKIQSTFKGLKSRKFGVKKSTLRNIETVSPPVPPPPVIPPEQEEIDIDLNDPEVEKAAMKIQATFKGLKSRKFGSKKSSASLTDTNPTPPPSSVNVPPEEEIDIDLNDPEVEKAAVKIQATFKGLKSRKFGKSKTSVEQPLNMNITETKTREVEIVDIDLADPDVEKAAVKIQASFKGLRARKTKVQKESESSPSGETQENKEEDKEDVDIDLNDPETAQAALKIQAGFRGYKTRKEVKESLQGEDGKPSEETPQTDEGKPSEGTTEEAKQEEAKTEETKEDQVDIDLNDPDVAKAATKIQAGFKGYKVRKDMKNEKAGDETTTDETPQEEQSAPQEEAPAPTEETSAPKEEGNEQAPAPTEDVPAPTEEAPAPTEDAPAPTEEAPAPTEEAPKQGPTQSILDLPVEDSQRILEALSAFKTFKKPEKLPDKLKLSRNHAKKLMKWYQTAKENIEEGTFTGMRQAAFQTQKTFSGFGKKVGFLDDVDDSSDDDDLDDFDDVNFMKNFMGGEGENEGLDFFDESKMDNFFGKMFLGLGNSMTEDGNISKSGVSESLGGMMTGMTQQASTMAQPMMRLFDKALYYKPVIAAIEKLEPWIEQSRNILDETQIQNLQKQLDLYIEIKELFDQETEDDEPHEKEARGAKVVELSQEIEKIGPLPKNIQDAMNQASGQMDMDNLPKMMNDMTGILTEGLSNMFSGGPKANETDECTIL